MTEEGSLKGKSAAEGLLRAVGELSDPAKARLRRITDLTPGEIDVLVPALARQAKPLAEMALKLINEWDHLKESERVASLLVLREILLREILVGAVRGDLSPPSRP